MREKTVDCWEELESDLDALQEDHSQEGGASRHKLLFRGQGDSEWGLLTTLDRIYEEGIRLSEYYRSALKARPRIETFTGKHWHTPEMPEYVEKIRDGKVFFGDFPGHEYLAYLRHHGFPSPLLDWTTSPYVAAFFAFNRPPKEAEHVSIFVFCKSLNGGVVESADEAIIHELGPYVRVHPRHYLQQSRYTVCVIERENDLYYAPHSSSAEKRGGQQDVLWKFNVPQSERVKAMRKLKQMNINAFSLFSSEDSLIEATATEEFFLQ